MRLFPLLPLIPKTILPTARLTHPLFLSLSFQSDLRSPLPHYHILPSPIFSAHHGSSPFPFVGDPLLRELVSTVISATLAQAPPTSNNSSKKSKKDKTSQARETLLEVILHDTILFPEGGGQPNDIGIITSADGELWDVVDVKRRGGHASTSSKSKKARLPMTHCYHLRQDLSQEQLWVNRASRDG